MNSLSASPTVLLTLYCALVLLASLAGGWLLLAMHLTHARLQTAVSFVAGLMLGMALLHFIPHSFHQNQSMDQTVRWVLLGFLGTFLLQRFLPHHFHDVPEEADEPAGSPDHAGGHAVEGHSCCAHDHGPVEPPARRLSWAATTVGMAFHSLLDGVALAAAVSADASHHGGLVGLGTLLVIILHKPFDAMAISTLMAASGCSRFSRHCFNGLFALVTPLGAVLFYVGASQAAAANPVLLGGALAFCAGTFLCIACADLLPELQFHSHDRVKLSVALLAGIGVTILIGQFESSGHDQHHDPPPAAQNPQ